MSRSAGRPARISVSVAGAIGRLSERKTPARFRSSATISRLVVFALSILAIGLALPATLEAQGHGVTIFKSCVSPKNTCGSDADCADPGSCSGLGICTSSGANHMNECTITLTNSDATGDNIKVLGASDNVMAFAGNQIFNDLPVSGTTGTVMGDCTVPFDPLDPCILAPNASISFLSNQYVIQPADPNPLPDQATVQVQDLCNIMPSGCNTTVNGVQFTAATDLTSGCGPGPTCTPTPTNTSTNTPTPTPTPTSTTTSTRTSTPTPTPTPSDCPTCAGPPVVVDQNVLADFNALPPTCIGDADLCAFFSFDNSGPTPDTWRAIFDLGARPLIVQSGATITTSKVGAGNNKYAPGIEIITTCTIEVEAGGAIVVESLNKPAGDIVLRADGAITIDGTVSNSVAGTNGLPGDITIATCCGDITTGRGSLIQTLGTDPGGSDINLLTCCEEGDINLFGLVMARAKAHTGGPRPDVRIVSFFGSVTIHGDTVEPQYDEYNYAGTKYDLFPGVLSWVTHSSSPGSVQIQARDNVTVLGHGDDPTPPVRQSFGAVAAGTGTSNTTGGDIDVFALLGDITGTNRAFESFGRYNSAAVIRLFAGSDIFLSRPGGNSSFNPVVDSAAFPFAGQGGTNALHAFLGLISIGPNALVSATGNTPGMNLLTACINVFNNGTVDPPDANPGDDSGACAAGPPPLFQDCSDPVFGLGGPPQGPTPTPTRTPTLTPTLPT